MGVERLVVLESVSVFSILLSMKSRKVLIVGGRESLAVNLDHMAEALRGRSPSKSDVRSSSKESPPLA